MRYLLVLLLLVGCGASTTSDAGTDAGTDAGSSSNNDAGTDPLAGNWRLSGSVDFGGGPYMIETPIVITRASDGNYRVQGSGCTMAYETVNATTLRSLETNCSFTQANLADSKLNGMTPMFGSTVPLRFAADGGIRVAADVLSVSGSVINTNFPNQPGTYSYTGTR